MLCAQSWRYKPGQYIAGASGCGPPALPYKGLDNGPSSSSSSRRVPLPRTAQGAPGTYKGVPGAVLVSLHPGEGLTTAP